MGLTNGLLSVARRGSVGRLPLRDEVLMEGFKTNTQICCLGGYLLNVRIYRKISGILKKKKRKKGTSMLTRAKNILNHVFLVSNILLF